MTDSLRWYFKLVLEDKIDADIRIHEIMVDGASEAEAIEICYQDKQKDNK